MKLTPQEEAEELIERAALAWSLSEWPSTSINSFIRQEIPLPELIAVARTAASDKKDEECTCGTDPERSCRYCGYFIRLDRALQALRATGKVEL